MACSAGRCAAQWVASSEITRGRVRRLRSATLTALALPALFLALEQWASAVYETEHVVPPQHMDWSARHRS